MKKMNWILGSCTKGSVWITALLSLLFSVWFGKINALCGIPFPQGPGDLQIQTFFRWQLLIIPPLMAASEYLNSMKALEVFIKLRIKNDSQFLKSQLAVTMGIAVFWGAVVAVLGVITVPQRKFAVIYTILGQVLWMSLYLTLYFIRESAAAAITGTVFSTASLFFIGELWNPYCSFLPTSWTMASRSRDWTSDGIPALISIGGSTFFICSFLAIIYLMHRKRRMRI